MATLKWPEFTLPPINLHNVWNLNNIMPGTKKEWDELDSNKGRRSASPTYLGVPIPENVQEMIKKRHRLTWEYYMNTNNTRPLDQKVAEYLDELMQPHIDAAIKAVDERSNPKNNMAGTEAEWDKYTDTCTRFSWLGEEVPREIVNKLMERYSDDMYKASKDKTYTCSHEFYKDLGELMQLHIHKSIKDDINAAIEVNDKKTNSKNNVGECTHYEKLGIEPWDVQKAWATPEEFKGYLKLTALKYLSGRDKGESQVKDWKKAVDFLNKLIKEFPNG